MTEVCKVKPIGGPECGRLSTVMYGMSHTCECDHPSVGTCCDEHVEVVMSSGWTCIACGAPASRSEPVSL